MQLEKQPFYVCRRTVLRQRFEERWEADLQLREVLPKLGALLDQVRVIEYLQRRLLPRGNDLAYFLDQRALDFYHKLLDVRRAKFELQRPRMRKDLGLDPLVYRIEPLKAGLRKLTQHLKQCGHELDLRAPRGSVYEEALAQRHDERILLAVFQEERTDKDSVFYRQLQKLLRVRQSGVEQLVFQYEEVLR